MTKVFYIKKDDGTYEEVKAVAQVDFDTVLESRLERDRKRIVADYADYDDLKKKVADMGTEKEDLQKKVDEANAQLKTAQEQTQQAEKKATRVSVIHEYGISEDLADFVDGADEAEMRNKAEKLKKGIPANKLDVEKSTKPKDDDGDKGESADIAKKLFGKSDD